MSVDEPIGVSWFSRALILVTASGLACSSTASPAGTYPPDGGQGKGEPGSSGGSTSSSGAAASSGGVSGSSSGSSSSGGSGGGGAPGNPGDGGGSADASSSGLFRPYHDPGAGAWEMVAPSDVASVCKLDLSKLQSAETSNSWPFIVVRYGKVCYATASAKSFTPAEAWSTTKTLGATVTGIASYQSRNLPMTGPKTGPMTDMDRADKWLTSVTYNKDALLAHVMGMVAQDASLAAGQKTFAYDTVGTTEINSLSDVINAVVAQNTSMLTANIETFTQKFVFAPLGMKNSTWSSGSTTKVFAYSWSTDLFDMARIGLLLLDWGTWSGERLLDEQWVYRMTHPSFEDANTGFGYLTWLNSSSNWESISGGKTQGAGTPGPCAPVAIHKKYPHGASQNTDCNYSSPYTCAQKYDVGVFQAEGLMGQIIQGHRGLDIVIVARNAEPGGAGPGTAKIVWDALSPAVIAGDPMFKGDQTSFCSAYGGNNYAPDWHEDPPEL
jgi:hypothetical protein